MGTNKTDASNFKDERKEMLSKSMINERWRTSTSSCKTCKIIMIYSCIWNIVLIEYVSLYCFISLGSTYK